MNYGGVNGGTSIYANGNTQHNQGRGIYATGYAYGIQANQTMVGNWSDQPNAAGVYGTGQIGVYGSGSIAGFSGPSAFFTALSGDARVNARVASSVVQIRGTGTTSATTAFLVENSAGSTNAQIYDDGQWFIGTGNIRLSGTPGNFSFNTSAGNVANIGHWGINFQPLGYSGIAINIDNKIALTGSTFITGSLTVTGSTTISNILTLTPQNPLPSGSPTGSFAVSSSVPPKPYFYDGASWNALY